MRNWYDVRLQGTSNSCRGDAWRRPLNKRLRGTGGAHQIRVTPLLLLHIAEPAQREKAGEYPRSIAALGFPYLFPFKLIQDTARLLQITWTGDGMDIHSSARGRQQQDMRARGQPMQRRLAVP